VNIGSASGSGAFQNAVGESVTVSFANPDTFGQGGRDAEGLNTLKLKAPALVRANDNLVSTADYEAIIGEVASVQDVFAVDKYKDRTLFDGKFEVDANTVKIWVLPESGGEISPDLRQLIAQELGERRLTAIDNFVFNPVYTNWALEAEMNVSSNADVNTIRTQATDALLNEFGVGTSGFERKVYRSKIISILQSIPGVEFINLTLPNADLKSDENEVLRLIDNNIGLTINR
jgi:hypothetical protein